jgi:hypothetical protein
MEHAGGSRTLPFDQAEPLARSDRLPDPDKANAAGPDAESPETRALKRES